MKAHLALVISGLLFAAMSIIKKLLEPDFPDSFLASVRMLLAAAFILLLLLALGRRKELQIERSDVPSFAVLGLAFALAFYFYFLSLSELPFSLAVIFVFTAPLFAVVFESIIEKESIGRNVLAGMALLLFGAVAMFYHGISLDAGYLPGIAWGLIAAMCAAFAEEHIRLEERKYPLFNVVFWPMLIGGAFLGVLSISGGLPSSGISLSSLYFVGMLGLITAIAYFLYDYSLEFLEPHASSAVFNTSAILFSFLLASLLFGEPISPEAIGGGMLIALATAIINRYSPTHKLNRV